MPKSTKKIDFYQIKFTTAESYTFWDIITSPHVKDRLMVIHRKPVLFNILEQTEEYVIGIVETNKNHSIPPKTDVVAKTRSQIGLTTNESLTYANAVMFHRKHNVLLYEVNKNGCVPDHFVYYIYRSCKKPATVFKSFDIKLLPVLRSGEYERMMNMRLYKSFQLDVAEPSEIVKRYRHQDSSLIRLLRPVAALQSGRLSLDCSVEISKKKDVINHGLSSEEIVTLVDDILEVTTTDLKSYINELKVTGYEDLNSKLLPVDLLRDRLTGTIDLMEPIQHSDLLEGQRKVAIKELYDKTSDQLNKIFGT